MGSASGARYDSLASLCLLLVIGLTHRVSTQCTEDIYIDKEIIGNGERACTGYIRVGLDGDLAAPFMCGFFDYETAELACFQTGDNFNGDDKAYRCRIHEGNDVNFVGTDFPAIIPTGIQPGDRCVDPGVNEHCLLDCLGSPFFGNGSLCANPYLFAVACDDIDECSDWAHHNCLGPHDHDCAIEKPCVDRADCFNTIGSFYCECPDEWRGFGSDPRNSSIGCLDTDECAADPTLCGIDECVNVPGSYICQCTAGRDSENDTCSNIECGVVNDDIDYAILKYPDDGETVEYDPETLDASASYKCEEGFEPSHAAEHDGQTFNLHCRPDGQYCPCAPPRCNRRPCRFPPSDPHATTTIINPANGGKGLGVFGDQAVYTCLTGYQSGYTLDCDEEGEWSDVTGTCEDIDECEDGPGCSENAVCYNDLGSYFCKCNRGYVGLGTINSPCRPISCGEVPIIDYADRETMIGADVGFFNETVEYECIYGYRASTNQDRFDIEKYVYIVCRADGIWEPNPLPDCIPISCHDPGIVKFSSRVGNSFDFGAVVSYKCADGFRPENAVWNANNNYHSLTVQCGEDGWYPDVPECVDVNECYEYTNPCGVGNHICINEFGSYRCSCDDGYELDTDGRCVGFLRAYGGGPSDRICKIYELYGMCTNGGICVLTTDGYPLCQCQDGYYGDLCEWQQDEEQEEDTAFLISIVSICLSGILLIVTILIVVCLCIRLPAEKIHVPVACGPPPPRHPPITPRYHPGHWGNLWNRNRYAASSPYGCHPPPPPANRCPPPASRWQW